MFALPRRPLFRFILCSALLSSTSLFAATITVTTAADDNTPNDGSVSLREAIQAINNGTAGSDTDITSQGPGTFGSNDTINFNIPGPGVHTINVGSNGNGALPALSKPMTINGYSETGAALNTLANGDNAVILIELNGVNAGPFADGLLVSSAAAGSTIEGLAINRFPLNGLELQGNSNTVIGNFIGVNPLGDAQEPNGNDGIHISFSSDNIIGGSTPAARNVVSGNAIDGIHIVGSLALPAVANLIAGNFVGVSSSGVGFVGLRPNTQLPGTLSGNFDFGIEISGGNSNFVGGTSAGSRNVIGFNLDGIEIDDGGQNNLIEGNSVGLGADGVTNVGNELHGVVVRSDDNLAPPFGPGQANEPPTANNTIGGTAAGAGNIVANNGSAGVAIFGNPLPNNATFPPNTGNAILGNSIFQNGRSNPTSMIGIDLSTGFVYPKDDGVTANDSMGHGAANDPNNFQNFPVLSSALVHGGGGTTVLGSLSMATSPNETFRIEFFASNPDGSIPEGQTLLGFITATTDNVGTVSFSANLASTAMLGQVVTATASDAFYSTSEFSPAVVVSASEAVGMRGDFNGDGRSDILLRDTAGNIGIWLMNGPVIVSGGLVGSPGGTYTVVGVGDFDGDGKSDILLRDADGNLGMWLMNGTVIKSGALIGSPGGTYTVAAVADFNGDGKADILLRDNLGNLGMWIMNGPVITSGGLVGSPGGSYTVAGVGDFNGDGKADILLRDNLGNLGMWFMNGSTVISGAMVGSPGGSFTVAGVGDYDGDGKADILLRDNLGNLGMWIMNGSTITSGASVGSPSGFSVVGAGDYNGDLHADILLRNQGTGDVGMWLMNGSTISSGASVGPLSTSDAIVP